MILAGLTVKEGLIVLCWDYWDKTLHLFCGEGRYWLPL